MIKKLMLVIFFIACSYNLFAIDYFNTSLEKANNFQQQFKKRGGSEAGVSVIDKELAKVFTKEKVNTFKESKENLKNELNNILLANVFDGKKYELVKNQINDVHLAYIKESDQAILNILLQLDVKDREVMSYVLQYHKKDKRKNVKDQNSHEGQ